jgi:hypothetical protein
MCAVRLVHVRVGAVGHERLDALHHALGDIRMQVDRRDHGNLWPDHAAHHGVKRSVGIRARRRDHAAVVADVDRVQLSRGAQARAHGRERRLEKALVHRPAGFARSDDDGNRRPLPECVHLAIESRHFGGQRGRLLASFARDFLAFGVAQRAEMALLADRRERVALQVKAKDRDSRHSASSIHDC